jgi:hypothetical protein
MSGEAWDLLAGLRLVKALVRLDNMGQWDEIDWRHLGEVLGDDCLVILRLFFPGRLSSAEFVRRAAARLPAVFAALGHREILLELHNEPNHAAGIEGWGKAPSQARDFAWWYHEVRAGMRAAGYIGRLGFPGLAVGQGNHGERWWAIINRANLRASGWVGCHCYWQRPEELERLDLGGNWAWYRRLWPNKRLFVTEAGNSSCDNPALPRVTPERQRAEYLSWCRSAAAGGVAGVAFYMLGGSAEWASFRLYPETVRALAGFDPGTR